MQKATTMVALVALLAAFALVLVASNNPAQAQSEFSRVVPSDQDIPGFATGINIHEGDRVVIKASGTVDLDCNNPGSTDNVPPDGIDQPPPGPLVNANEKYGALLGSIGQFSNTNGGFLVGSEETFTASKSGELYLIVNDTLGGFTDNSCRHFTAQIAVNPDTKSPRVSSTVPSAGASGVAPGANIKADFSEDMRASTINRDTVKLFKKGSTTKAGATVSYNANRDRAILNPNNPLQRGVTYQAVVTTFATDEAGNRLDQKPGVSGLQQKSWAFTISD